MHTPLIAAEAAASRTEMVEMCLIAGIASVLWAGRRAERYEVWRSEGGQASFVTVGRLPRCAAGGGYWTCVAGSAVVGFDLDPDNRPVFSIALGDDSAAIEAIEVSPAGTRFALVSRHDGVPQLQVIGRDGVTCLITPKVELACANLTWLSEGHLVYLAPADVGRCVPMLLDLRQGSVARMGPLGAWQSVACGPDRLIYLLGQIDPVERILRGCSVFALRQDHTVNRLTHEDDDVDAVAGLRFADAMPVACVARRHGHALVACSPQAPKELGSLGQLGAIRAFDLQSTSQPGRWQAAGCGASVVSAHDTAIVELIDRNEPGRPFSSYESAVHNVRHIVARADDGVELDVWIHMPPGGDLVPVVLVLHGGPRAQSGPWLTDDISELLDAGFGVVAPNPRGSSGRGREFAAAIANGGAGYLDTADAQSCLTAALFHEPRLRGDRIGISGHSYGSVIACALAARNPDISSLVLDRPIGCWAAFHACAANGVAFTQAYLGPMAGTCGQTCPAHHFAHRIRTPVRIVLAGTDKICPPDQAKPLIERLRAAGNEVDTLLLPGANHDLPRSGAWRDRVARSRGIIDWHRSRLSSHETNG